MAGRRCRAASSMTSRRCALVTEFANTIKPPFDSRAAAAMARSRSAPSRAPATVTFTCKGGTGPTKLHPHVTAIDPSQLLQPLLQGRDATLPLGVVLGEDGEHADTARLVRLLRARRKRP